VFLLNWCKYANEKRRYDGSRWLKMRRRERANALKVVSDANYLRGHCCFVANGEEVKVASWREDVEVVVKREEMIGWLGRHGEGMTGEVRCSFLL